MKAINKVQCIMVVLRFPTLSLLQRYYAEKKQRAQDSAMRKNNGHDSKDHHFVFEYVFDCVCRCF